MSALEKYEGWVEFSRLPMNAFIWLAISFALSMTIFTGTFALGFLLFKTINFVLPLAFGLASAVLLIGYPYMKTESIISSIEKNFSDGLKQMADTLKAGDTYESALREVANSDYGRLSEEMDLALRRLEEGENLESSLTGFAERINSKLIKRTITIILDSVKTGAGLADILDEIADDVRAFNRLKEERKANTTLQFMFMFLAGGIIAPAIFGEVSSVMDVFAKVSVAAFEESQLANTKTVMTFILTIIQVYILIEVIATGAMMSIIREGKLNKSIIYIPILLLIAFVTYYFVSFFTSTIVSGVV